jgi:3-phenylpropionate/trans-cinnamate dioxygenase ferredoxin reductase component
MSALDRYVIVGAALAGAKTAQALREQGFEGQIVLIGQETTFPYERPELSKGYLTGKTERHKLFVHEAAWYAENQVELRLDTTVRAIDRAAHEVELADGTALHYDKLLLSTGARPRRIDLTGADAKGVYYLRTVEQSQQLRELFARIKRLVVIGAGWIGLEVTAAARAAGVAVTVFESARLPLLNVLGPEAAQVFADLHAANGVDLRFGATLAEITVADGQATGVRLEDGTRVESDAVLVAIGAAPNVDLAEAAGLRVDNGVIVDAALRTDDPDIFAAGDVANAFHPFYDKRVRVEHWANALKQPATAAAAMLGHEASYAELPYFYSDQYDLGMEFVGLVEPGGYSDVVFRGDLLGREFIAFWLSEGRVIAGMNVNVWDVTDAIKDLIRSRRPIDPVRLANPEVPLDSL